MMWFKQKLTRSSINLNCDKIINESTNFIHCRVILAMLPQRSSVIFTAAVYILIAENSNNSEQKRAGITHGEDCWIQTEKKSQPTSISFEIDGVCKELSRPECPWLILPSNLAQALFHLPCDKKAVISIFVLKN